MKGVCAIHNDKALALVTRSSSHALMNLMLPPDHEPVLPQGMNPPWHPIMNLRGHDFRNGFPEQPVACMVRDPIERFRSACARRGKTAAEGLTLLANDVHFWPLADMGLLGEGVTHFLFPAQIDACAAWLGLPTPVPPLNQESEDGKPVLTEEEEAAVRAAYADDVALWESLQPQP
jgi:hypothetical protein